VHLTAPQAGFTGLMNELKSGSIDAAWLPEPFGTMAEQQMGAVQLADLDQGALQGFPIGCYIGTKSWTTTHPNTVAAFLRALRQGQQVADGNRGAVERSLEKHTQVPPLIADSMTVNNYPLSMSIPAIQRVADAMYEFGVLSREYEVTKMVQPEPGMVRSGM
jgi:NitT/TauT family transport system substrate-binding protein